jgi:hypothetical protein
MCCVQGSTWVTLCRVCHSRCIGWQVGLRVVQLDVHAFVDPRDDGKSKVCILITTTRMLFRHRLGLGRTGRNP